MERAAALPHHHRQQPSEAIAAASPHKRKIPIKLIVAVALTAAALLDWTRPPREQWSVRLYDVAVIKSYRTLLRPVTSKVTRCRFQPTCSRYSQEAMHNRGFPEGLILTVWRIARCGPWVKPGTHDPVPRGG
jgi:putative membrane protein insertion efficiency factor